MKILILGGAGMLGHRLWMDLSARHHVWATTRSSGDAIRALPGVDGTRVCESVDVLEFDSVTRAFGRVRPDVVINCVGLVKQHPLSNDALTAIEINSRLPHRLALLCGASGARLIHISTDCVFSGRTGHYTEESVSDAEDLYGRTKYLGEVAYPHALTIRTSIIGRELSSRHGLAEWFLSQRDSVTGFKRAIFTGFTTQVLATILLDYVLPDASLSGVWQVSSDPISKYDLLVLMNDAYGRGITIRADETFVLDRSLDSSRFRAATGLVPPSWPDMISQMAATPLPYENGKR